MGTFLPVRLTFFVVLVATYNIFSLSATGNEDVLADKSEDLANSRQQTEKGDTNFRTIVATSASSKIKETINEEQEEETTNPPFPSQSSSFWEREDEAHHDYETNPGSILTPSNKEDVKTANDDEGQTESTEKPNIILIITDDQDIELGSMEYMPETLKVFREGGVEFRHGYVSTPICCPSRSSLLTGLYVHNHEVFTNNDNCSSIQWREKFEKKTFASYLWSSGYYTSYIGKYLNKYDGSHIPYGWDEWNGLLMNSRYYNYTLNRNGKRFRYGNDLENDYYPDSIARDSLDFLERVANDKSKQPFLLVLSFPSPHGPEDSAPRYSNLFLNATPHHTPNYNYAPNSDKQWILRVTDKMTPTLKEFTNLLMTKRLQTLQSVDIAVRDIFQKLEAASLRDSTYSFYTSDHGYHVGQFGLVKGKSMPYEFDIRVPFFLAGPKSMVEGGTMIKEPVLNIDIAPTFLELANLPIPDDMDGRSMVPLIKKYCPSCTKDENLEWPDVFLIESPGRRSLPTSPNSGSGEIHDKITRRLAKRKHRDKVIVDDDEVLSLTRLCAIHPHPCMPGQKKYCRKERNRIRFRKCRQNIDFYLASTPRFNDPVYGHNISIPEVSNQKCSCRIRRSVVSSSDEKFESDDDDADNVDTDDIVTPADWENERKQIDDEIEKLKQRIEYLRQRRKEIRRKWLADNNVSIKTRTEQEKVKKQKNTGEDYPQVNLNRMESTTASNIEEAVRAVPQAEDYDASIESEEVTDKDDDDEEEEDSAESFGEQHNINQGMVDAENVNRNETKFPVNVENKFADVDKIEEGDKNEGYEATVNEEVTSENVVAITSSTPFSTSTSSKLMDMEDDRESSTVGSIRRHHQRGKNKQNQKNRLKGIYMMNKEQSTASSVASESSDDDCNCYNNPRWLRQKEREDRKHRKILSKIRKKQRLIKRIDDPVKRHEAETCGKEEKMNCFWHDSDHWRTAPFWTSGSFCFCMNANNNSYSCLRSVNSTHNYLYCQFITGFKMYFDLMQDPYQLKNIIDTLPATSEDWIMTQLYKLKQCKGKEECWANESMGQDVIHPSLWEQIFGRWPKKRRRGGKRRKFQQS